MKALFLSAALASLMATSAMAQTVTTPSSATNVNVPTGYQVKGATWYYQDRYQNNRIVQVPDLNTIPEIHRAMQDPAHPKSMVKGDGGSGGSGGN
jgi:hypothetical protein